MPRPAKEDLDAGEDPEMNSDQAAETDQGIVIYTCVSALS